MLLEGKTIRVLLMEDDEDDAALVRGLLGEITLAKYELAWVATHQAGIARLCSGEHDVCLLDYYLDGVDGLEVLQALARSGCRAPIIILTGKGNREVDLAAMQAGAMDYLEKGAITPDLLERVIRYAIQRRQTEETLRASEARFRGTFENAAVGISHMDRNGQWLRVNEKLCEILGYARKELLQKNFLLATYPEDRAAEAELYARLIRGEIESYALEKRFMRKDGEAVWIHVSRTLQRDTQGQPLYAISVIQDINDRKRAEDALRAANERLAEADRRKDEFMAMLAHELRNPLAPIRYATQMLQLNGSALEHLQKQREMIDRQVRHMGRLLDDLLDISRITRGKIQLRRETVDLRTVAEQAIESMRPMVEGRRQNITFQPLSSPVLVDGDSTRLEQIIRNLLHNANKFTEAEGCIGVSVGLEEQGRDWRAVVRVRDSGVGLAPEIRPHIFEAFVQAEQSLARSQGGLGIGLSMVRNLVELHGGSVEAHSAGPGRGSEFIVRLPLAESVSVEAQHPEQDATGRQTQAGPCRVLVVDDNEDSAASLSDLLRLWGHEVQTAYDGHHALAAALQWRPEVILLDIGLPGMDGYQVAEHLRREPVTQKAFIVALTGYGAEEDRRRAQESGFDQHLTKPVELERLQAVLRGSCAT